MEEVERTLTDVGREISNWYQVNLLKCNPDKFQWINIFKAGAHKQSSEDQIPQTNSM